MKYDAPKEFKFLSTILTSTGGNSTYLKGRVSYSKDSFVVKQTLVFQINFCGESPDHRKSARRKCDFMK
jgi:hypothetical protein